MTKFCYCCKAPRLKTKPNYFKCGSFSNGESFSQSDKCFNEIIAIKKYGKKPKYAK